MELTILYINLKDVHYYEFAQPCNYDWCAMLIIYRPPRRSTTKDRTKAVPAIGVTNATIADGRWVYMPMVDIDTHEDAQAIINRIEKLFPGAPYLVQRTGRGMHVFVAYPTTPTRALKLSAMIPPKTSRDNGWIRIYRIRMAQGLPYMGVIRIHGKYEKNDIETVKIYAPDDKPESNWILNVHRAYLSLNFLATP